MFEKATRQKLRFSVPSVGSVSTEDLWDLSLTALNNLAKSINRDLKAEDEEDFLKPNVKNNSIKLKFDIVKHILDTKVAEKDAAALTKQKAEERQRILEILAKKQNESLENLSEEELIAKLEQL